MTESTESVAEFAARARAWLADNMPAIDPESPPAAPRDDERVVATSPRTAKAAL